MLATLGFKYLSTLLFDKPLHAGAGNGNPVRYTCLENPMDRGAWWATVHGVTKSQTFTFPSHSLQGPQKARVEAGASVWQWGWRGRLRNEPGSISANVTRSWATSSSPDKETRTQSPWGSAETLACGSVRGHGLHVPGRQDTQPGGLSLGAPTSRTGAAPGLPQP